MKKTFVFILMALVAATALAANQRGLKRQDYGQSNTAAEHRVALLIGNKDYKRAPLANPINDVRAMAGTLGQLGFEVITLENAGKRDMEKGVRQFRTSLEEKNGVGLFYYAGHGIQVDGVNYLVPIGGSDMSQAHHIKSRTVSTDWVMKEMERAQNRVSIVILDACRDNPFAVKGRSLGRGLAQISGARGTLIAYSTSPGEVASDGDGDNSTFTTHLLTNLGKPGLTVEELFKAVRVGVSSETNGEQLPWTNSSITGEFYFNQDAKVTVAAAAPTPVIAPKATVQHTQPVATTQQQVWSQPAAAPAQHTPATPQQQTWPQQQAAPQHTVVAQQQTWPQQQAAVPQQAWQAQQAAPQQQAWPQQQQPQQTWQAQQAKVVPQQQTWPQQQAAPQQQTWPQQQAAPQQAWQAQPAAPQQQQAWPQQQAVVQQQQAWGNTAPVQPNMAPQNGAMLTQQNYQVFSLLQRANAALAAKKLTTPTHDNAVLWATQVLAMQPNNNQARMLLSQVVQRYMDWMNTALAKRQAYKAQSYLARVTPLQQYATPQQTQQLSYLGVQVRTAVAHAPPPRKRTARRTAKRSTRKSSSNNNSNAGAFIGGVITGAILKKALD